MSRTSKSPLAGPNKPIDNPELLTLPPGPVVIDASSPNNEINLKVQQKQELLLDLKRQQEEIERQKRDLEEMGRKQREFSEGQRDVVEKLTRGLVLLERQDFEVKRELEQIKLIRDSFTEQLALTENLRPEDSPGDEMSSELTRSLARVDQAKSVYNQARARLGALRQLEEGEAEPGPGFEGDLEPAPEKSFWAMVQEGLAYSLPLILTLSLLILIYLLAQRR